MSPNWSRRLALLLTIAVAVLGCGGDSLRADAGDDFTVILGEGPRFDGCNSEGDIAQYAWFIREAPPRGEDAVDTTLNSSSDCSYTVDPMVTDDLGSWTIELIVTDQDGASSSDEVTVTVAN